MVREPMTGLSRPLPIAHGWTALQTAPSRSFCTVCRAKSRFPLTRIPIRPIIWSCHPKAARSLTRKSLPSSTTFATAGAIKTNPLPSTRWSKTDAPRLLAPPCGRLMSCSKNTPSSQTPLRPSKVWSRRSTTVPGKHVLTFPNSNLQPPTRSTRGSSASPTPTNRKTSAWFGKASFRFPETAHTSSLWIPMTVPRSILMASWSPKSKASGHGARQIR